jgi:hypothetical protein
MASATKSILFAVFSQRIPVLSKLRGASYVAAGLLLGFASALFLCNVHAARPMTDSVEFYGDSITSGIRVNCGRTAPECNDQTKAFSALIGGRILGVPGQGVIHPGGFHGERPDAEEYFSQNYSKDHEPRFVVIGLYRRVRRVNDDRHTPVKWRLGIIGSSLSESRTQATEENHRECKSTPQ